MSKILSPSTGSFLTFLAMQDYGLSEVPGALSEEKILKMLQRYVPAAEDDSKYGWCGVYMANLFKQANLDSLIPQNPQLARNWTKLQGLEVSLEDAKPGDIIVFWRGTKSGWQGHVAIFVNQPKEGVVNVLGGNQGNAVNISGYSTSRILKIIRI